MSAPAATAAPLRLRASTQGGGVSQVVLQISRASGTLTSQTMQEIPARLSGQLVVHFRGDAANGCAALGLCAAGGTIVWAPAPVASLMIQTFETTNHRTVYAIDLQDDPYYVLSNSGGGVTSASVSDGTISTCADAANTGSSLSAAVTNGDVQFSPRYASPDLLETRCAGPLTSDISRSMPKASLSLRALRRGRTTLDMSGSGAFASHGFQGEVDSTLAVHLGKPGRTEKLPPSGIGHHLKSVEVDYRAAVSGNVTVRVSGDADAGLCGPLGACGLDGKLSVSAAGARGSAQMTAFGPAKRPERDFLAALHLSRSGRAAGIFVFGSVTWGRSERVSAQLLEGGVTCRDTVRLGPAEIDLSGQGKQLVGGYVGGYGPTDPFRTRCAGPFSPPGLVVGSAPVSALGKGRATLSFSQSSPLLDDGYTGRIEPRLRVVLSHRHLVSPSKGGSPELTTVAN